MPKPPVTFEGNYFDENPVKIGGFLLLGRSVQLVSEKVTPTRDGWQEAFELATASEESSPYWVGDLLDYASKQPDWSERLDQMQSRTGLAEQTLRNRLTISRNVKGKARELAPSISHAGAVASLNPKDQIKVLDEAKTDRLTVSQTAKRVRRILRPRIIAGQAELKGKYRVLYTDPPWKYDNDGGKPDGSLAPADSSYEGMTFAQLCALPIEAHTMKDAVLWMWATNAHLDIAIELGRAWGFDYKTNHVWNKVHGRPGPYGFMIHEMLLIFTRGSCTPDADIKKHDHASIHTYKREGSFEHSEKPGAFRKVIKSLYLDGPYLELFARERVVGWDAFGNDARLWAKKQSA